MKTLLTILLVGMLSAFCSPPSVQEEIQTVEVHPYTHSQKEMMILQSVNDYRVSKGLNSLQIDETVSFICFQHSESMYYNGVITHAGFEDRVRRIGVTLVGENLAKGIGNPLQSWLNSPPHKANLEDNWTHFGLGEKNGYVTLILIRRR